MEKLAEKHQVIFYDQRGCGRSTGEISAEKMQVDVFVEDIESLRKSFGFKKMTVLGHSWGGFLAMNYAIKHPEAVNKLVILNSVPGSADDFALFFKEWARRMASSYPAVRAIQESDEFKNGDPVATERYYHMLFEKYCFNPEMGRKVNVKLTPQAAVNGSKVFEMFKQTLYATPFNIHAQLKELNVPTLIIHGDADPVPPITAERLHQSIKGSQYILLKDCGHFPYVEDSDSFFKHLEPFLDR
jgi:proline iminopeptidase